MAQSDMVRVLVNRDSVCMADDVQSHQQVWELDGTVSVAELLSMLARYLLPSVAGFAGWRIDQELGQREWGLTLGLIYTRDHLRQERYVCLADEYPQTVADLVRRAPTVALYAGYLTGAAAQPRPLSELTKMQTWTGGAPRVLETEAQLDAEQDWQLMRRLASLIRDSHGPRRSWVREFLRTAEGIESALLFSARNMALASKDLRPLSKAIAAHELLGVTEPDADQVFAAIESRDASLGVVAAVFGAFEAGLSRELRRQSPPTGGRVYLDFLAQRGYRLSPVEQFLAGYLDFAGLRATLDSHRLQQ